LSSLNTLLTVDKYNITNCDNWGRYPNLKLMKKNAISFKYLMAIVNKIFHA